MPFLTADGIRFRYEVHGDGNGTPLVLTHCLAGSSELWRENVRALSSGRKVITWDCRGHGQTSAPEDPHAYGITRSARDLKALLDALEVEAAHIAGISMGGGISACFAILFPQHTTSLMVMDSNTAAGLPTPPAVRASREQTIHLAANATTAADRAELVAQFLRDNPSYRVWDGSELAAPPTDHLVSQMVSSTPPAGLGNTVRCMMDSDFPVARVHEISVPTLVLAGSHDPGMKAVLVTHERITQSKLVEIEGAGHLSNLDQPAAFEQAVLTFLEEVEGRET